ncbi:MAG: class I SAM-dependent methyltransferase [Ginsengibacter sp.]
MKDNFSKQADNYSKFRPGYPQELFDFLISLVPEQKTAWDCGTGNGQVALKLSEYFEVVHASDISANQLANAMNKDNIYYSLASAEETSYAANKFDLVTVGQAIHWFNFDRFYKEANRILKTGGYIPVFGYNILQIDKETDKIITDFYKNVTGPYWDDERKYVDENYATITFPFNEIKAPALSGKYHWTLEQVTGYLHTWSGVQHYIKKNNNNPVNPLRDKLSHAWGNTLEKEVSFPIFMRVGRK